MQYQSLGRSADCNKIIQRDGLMNEIKKHLLDAQHDLEEKYESPIKLIDRLRADGKSLRTLKWHY